MTRILKIAAALALACIAQVARADLPPIGFAYVHTARNAPSISSPRAQKIGAGDLVPAENLEIKCGENQRVFLIFSNRTVLEIGTNASLKIASFRQSPPFSFSFNDDSEKTRSTLEMKIEKGNVYLYGLRPRMTSSAKISTPFGNFEIKSAKFVMGVREEGLKIAVLDGQSTFKGLNGKTDFIQNKQRGSLTKEKSNAKYPLKIEYLASIEEDAIDGEFADCKTVFNSVEFSVKDGKMRAERVTPKEFLKRPERHETP